MELTKVQHQILTATPLKGFILLRDLSDNLGMSSNHVRTQIRKLEESGHVSLGRAESKTAPLKISLVEMIDGVHQNFDKLLFSTRWV
jgi:transcription initiation factor IIE alpha subunit